MQNVLTFRKSMPQRRTKTKSVLWQFKKSLGNYKISQEQSYQKKIKFLKNECYDFYLKEILKQRRNSEAVDFPDFVYLNHSAICQEALNLSNLVVDIYEKVYGRKFIEKCYKQRIQKCNS